MMDLTGRHVTWKDHDGTQLEGKIVDFFASATEGIFALVLMQDGKFRTVDTCELQLRMDC